MGTITILGHGYEENQLTLEAVELLKSDAKVILHTGRCGCAEWLSKNGIPFETLDSLYEECEDFDEHAQKAAEAVIQKAKEGDVVYGVFDVRDYSVSAILNQVKAKVVAGPPAEGALTAYASDTVKTLVAADWAEYRLTASEGVLIRELDSRAMAGEVKLRLMECYPEEETVFVRMPDGGIARTPLYNLDRLGKYDHRTSVYVPAVTDFMQLERYDFNDLQKVMARLLGENGCPWDREQTHESLKPYVVEEAYEIIDAIDAGEPYHLADELGDMLFQVAFHTEIAKKYSEFDMSDVTTAICEKMIERHSHIFGTDHAARAEEVSTLWEKNKMQERGQTKYSESLKEVSKSLPAMMRANKVFKRMDRACKMTETPEAALEKLKTAVAEKHDLGEILLCCAALARAQDVDPEIALNAETDRMIRHFERLENGAEAKELDAETLKRYWHSVKKYD